MKNLWRGILCSLLVAGVIAGLWATAHSQMGGVAESEISPAGQESAVQGPGFSLQKLTSESELIALGTCTELRTAWVADGRILVTLATIAVNDVIKGEPVSSLTVMLPGGTDSKRRFPVSMTYPHAAQIALNEEVFLFLSEENDLTGDYTVTGEAQGKLSIVKDANGQRAVARGLTRVSVPGGPGTARGTAQLTPLSQLVAQVESYQP